MKKLKSYCLKCKKETDMMIVRAIYNRTRFEKKVEGMCKTCGEYLCKIISTINYI